MQVARIGPKHQITIPDEIFKRLRLKPGDFLALELREDAFVAVPQALIPRDQAWFWSEEWQEGEREVDAELAAGDLLPEFESVDEMFDFLNRE